MKTQEALQSIAATFTNAQWRELFRRSKRWPRDKWSMLYPAYLRSRAWNAKRMARHEIDGFRCIECGGGATQRLTIQCHHLTYERIGDEDVNQDLITLCAVCHGVEHQEIKPLQHHLALAMEEIARAILNAATTPRKPI